MKQAKPRLTDTMAEKLMDLVNYASEEISLSNDEAVKNDICEACEWLIALCNWHRSKSR